MGNLSPHFDSSEFVDHRDGTLQGPAPELIQRLEQLRALKGGRPLVIISGYRSPATNRAVGGVPRSQHLYGRAADIDPSYCSLDEAVSCGFRGVGYSSGGRAVHVDVRPGPAVTFRDGP